MSDQTAPTTVPPPGTTDQPTTHAKRAQFVAVILLVIIVVGLVVQTYLQMDRRSARDQKREAEQQAQAARQQPALPRKSVDEFAKDADRAERQLTATQEVEAEKTARDQLLEAAAGKTTPGSAVSAGNSANGRGGQSVAGNEVDENDPAVIQRNFIAAEFKRALEARRAGIGHTSASGKPGGPQQGVAAAVQPYGQGQPFGTPGAPGALDAKLAAARSARETAVRGSLQALQDAQAKGVQIPGHVVNQVMEQARIAGIDPAQAMGASSGGDSARLMPASLTNARGQDPATFGESAQNRAFRAPADAGPRPGEILLGTSTSIPVVLDQDVMSDYDGNWKAVVQRPVYDNALENILFPAGTKITGKTYRASGVNEPIQNRMGFNVLWAIRPDGKRIDFRRTSGVDVAGIAAVKDQVDRHIAAQVFGVLAYAVIGLGPSTQDFGTEPQSSADYAVREATSQARTMGRSFAQKYLSIVPTVLIRAGTPMKIIVEDDLYITPWTPLTAGHYN